MMWMFSHLFISFIFPSSSSRSPFAFETEAKAQKKATRDDHSKALRVFFAGSLCCVVFFVAHSEGTKERRSSVMILIFLYFYFAIYSAVHLLYNFYCSDRCCSQPQPRVYKTLFSAVSHFYRLREILSFASFYSPFFLLLDKNSTNIYSCKSK